MDVNSGRLVADIELLDGTARRQFTPVPDWLADDARRALDGRSEATISLNERNNLTAWAANTRKKNRARDRMAKKSRARNRK